MSRTPDVSGPSGVRAPLADAGLACGPTGAGHEVVLMLARPTSLFAPRILAAAARARPNGTSTPSNSAPPARPLVPAAG